MQFWANIHQCTSHPYFSGAYFKNITNWFINMNLNAVEEFWIFTLYQLDFIALSKFYLNLCKRVLHIKIFTTQSLLEAEMFNHKNSESPLQFKLLSSDIVWFYKNTSIGFSSIFYIQRTLKYKILLSSMKFKICKLKRTGRTEARWKSKICLMFK